MQTITIFFGEMGSGKNYHGEHYAKQHDQIFFDGDTVATPELIDRVSQFKPLTRDIIRNYVSHLTAQIFWKAIDTSKNLVVAQALYFDEDRKFIRDSLEALGYNVVFYLVRISLWQNLKQLWSRHNGFKWIMYWIKNHFYFEPPTHNHISI